MNAEFISQLFRERFANRSLIVVSNREPYIHRDSKQGIKVDKPAGGVTSALDPVISALEGTWIAWGSGSADKKVTDRQDKIKVPPEAPKYTLKRVWLDQRVVDGFYYGYSNQVLWPLSHMLLEKVRFIPRYWKWYNLANQKFASAVNSEVKNKKGVVWIQDYHFTLLPSMVREKNPDSIIAMFWHIPWPPWEIFRVIPQRVELLKGMLGCNLIAFHIDRYCKNFVECVQNGLGASFDSKNNNIVHETGKTGLAAIPISIDYDFFDRMTRNEQSYEMMNQLQERLKLKDKYIGIGVDRLDYSKGILERMEAIKLFLAKYPKYHGKFTFIQIAVPSRTKIRDYMMLKNRIEKLVEEINAKYKRADWIPIIYLSTNIPHSELINYYRMADIAIVSSIVDGMNLVAKEYIASQVDEKGVLLLSEFVGAVSELNEALVINPFDVEHFSEMIRKGLEMPEVEKRRRMQKMRAYVQTHTIFDWINDNLKSLESTLQQ